MSLVGSQHVWASQDDWEAHRETISRLYWDDCRPLPDVMEIMRSEHNFHATPRMYKFRFKKWGLAKNLKNDQDEEIRVQAASGGNPAVPLIRGRVPGSKKLKRYVHRLAPDSLPDSAIGPSRVRSPVCRTAAATTGNDGSTRPSKIVVRGGRGKDRSSSSTASSSSSVVTTPRSTNNLYAPSPPPPQPPTSVLRLLSAPDSLKFTHQTLRAVLEYTSSRVRKGVWDSSGSLYDVEDHAENWHNKLFQASGMIQRGKFREGFRLLDICYKNYTAQLDAEHPFLIIESYTSVLNLARIEHALAHSLVRYIAGLCRIRLGPAHPLARFWAGLLAMGLPQVRQTVGAVVRVQYDLFDAYFAPGAEFLIVQNVDAARILHESGCIPLSQAEAIIARAIQQRRLPKPDGSPPRPGADDFVCWARLILGLLYIRDGRCDLAAPVIDDVGAKIRAAAAAAAAADRKPPAPGDEISLFTQNEYHTMRVHLLRGSGSAELLAAALRERFDFCLRTSGPSNSYTTRAFDELDQLYRGPGPAGDIAAAERLRADFDFAVQWDEVCRREEERVAAAAAAAARGMGEGRVIGEDVESDAPSDDT